MKGPELLSPAGSLKRMRRAFAYGADAVYAGQPRYSLRARNNEFSHENLVIGINEAHAQGKLFFVASNIIAQNNKINTYLDDLAPVVEAGPDALIMTDPGLIMMVRERWPQQPVHLSVQSSVMNFASVKFWQTIGIERVILSRELSLKEIQAIREQCPDIELEVFVHGALCMAYSGRCLLSGYFNHRDPNQGACTNACRWKYDVKESKEDDWGNHQIESKSYVFEQNPQRAGAMNTIEEDEHGTYLFNSKDLRAIQHIEALTTMGIDCVKIEGRTKSDFYVARTAQLYRKAIDDAVAGKPFDWSLMDALEGLSLRGYTEGFYRRHVPEEYQSYNDRNTTGIKQQVVAEMVDYDSNRGMLTVNAKNQFSIGDTIEVMLPTGNQIFCLEAIEDKLGQSIERAAGSGHVVKVPVSLDPAQLEHGYLIRHWREEQQ
ncbi:MULTISPECIES: tRNA 5-hydroxyuridine modification protein YegQ [unclassified Legionella]|uniref:prephenate-dependent tRNA uridine(34) hydroxylase TrhP n=1 Tax=unclassified Legionella TaxID=2622702 RepID=UPI00105606C0|nr:MULTISPECIES: tRNA 5-hydroxyuridine modification protein YegQ [unclassified Legionella]MDI9819475.1 tRNA 5-hydroxyuridine modification protein YegQ [Legionella sp. PL877]